MPRSRIRSKMQMRSSGAMIVESTKKHQSSLKKCVHDTNHTTVILKVRSWIFDGEFFTLLSQIQFHHPLFSFITIIQYWSCTETCCDGLLKQIVLYACTINSSSNHGGNPRVVLVSVQGPRPQVMRMGLGMQVIAYSCSPHSSMCIVVTYVSMPSYAHEWACQLLSFWLPLQSFEFALYFMGEMRQCVFSACL